MAFMAAAPMLWATVGSTVLSMMSASKQADAQNAAAKANADNANAAALANQQQLNQQAGQETAAGQYAAANARLKSQLMLSRAQAVAAASGGGPLDETLMNGIIGEGEKAAGFQAYSAKERASGLTYRGQVGVAEANNQGRANIEAAARAGKNTTLGALSSGVMSIAGRFAGGPAPGAALSTDLYGSAFGPGG